MTQAVEPQYVWTKIPVPPSSREGVKETLRQRIREAIPAVLAGQAKQQAPGE